MRYQKVVFGLALGLAFTAGMVVSPLLPQLMPGASAANAAADLPALQVIDLTTINFDNMPATSNPAMHAQTFYNTANGSIGIQAGNNRKHIHVHNDEIQYIIEGTGSIWLGNERKDFKPGTLLVMPKGTPHGGALVTSNGPVKALTIKLPPWREDDTQVVD
jgi:mannose-6-phosphate isomerase-like protein (cupin superfamily)